MVQSESHPLRNYAYQLTRNVEDANDLLQETMLKAFTYHNKFSEDNNAESKFMMKDMAEAIDTLPHDLKKTFTMNYKGFKYHEIAEILNIPIGTVKTRSFVARRMLRKKLWAYGQSY
eukprot:gene45667-61048_t